MSFELIIECILHGNDKQKELAYKILSDYMKELQESENGKDN